MKILFGHSERLAEIAAQSLPDVMGENGFGPCQAIGIVTGYDPTDELLAVAVYFNYQPKFKTCAIAMVSFSPRWAQKGTIRAILSVPFEQYGVKKLSAICLHTNERVIKLLEGVGFKREAVLAHEFGAKRHAVVLRMMEADYLSRYKEGACKIGKLCYKEPSGARSPTPKPDR